jgi:carboxyvinyl-carboxyphosphonate phosphorylmutase
MASLMDPLSARVAEQVGYEVGALLSSAASMAVLAGPDLSLLSLTEMVEQTCRVTRACDLPVLVDGEQGFGNALNVRRTVTEIEAAGAAGVTIEDTVLPRAFKAGDGYQLVSVEEGRAKMRAALDGRSDPSFLVLARTSAFSVGSIDEALLRVTAYEEEGVDAIFLSGIKTLDHLNAARNALSLPIVVGAVGPELQDQDVLRRSGVSLWAQGNQPHFAALHALRVNYEAVLRGELPGAITPATSDPFVDGLLEGPLYKRRVRDFLS